MGFFFFKTAKKTSLSDCIERGLSESTPRTIFREIRKVPGTSPRFVAFFPVQKWGNRSESIFLPFSSGDRPPPDTHESNISPREGEGGQMCKRERVSRDAHPPARRPRPRLKEDNSTNILLFFIKSTSTFGAFLFRMKMCQTIIHLSLWRIPPSLSHDKSSERATSPPIFPPFLPSYPQDLFSSAAVFLLLLSWGKESTCVHSGVTRYLAWPHDVYYST